MQEMQGKVFEASNTKLTNNVADGKGINARKPSDLSLLLLPLPLPLPLRLSHCYALLSNSAACSGFRELVKIIGLYCAQFALTRPREREPYLALPPTCLKPCEPYPTRNLAYCAFMRFCPQLAVPCPLSVVQAVHLTVPQNEQPFGPKATSRGDNATLRQRQ